MQRPRGTVVGLISDTHGTLDPQAAAALAGVDAIIHAGDVCSVAVLMQLETIAPVTAIAGNCDVHGPTSDLPHSATIEHAGTRILAIHDFGDVGLIPDDVDVVVCGHTHRPREEWHGNVLVVNPGSASQRRSMPSATVALLEIAPAGISFRLVYLSPGD